MKNSAAKRNILVKSVLASTLFIASQVNAATIVNGIENKDQFTGTPLDNTIIVTQTGQINSNLPITVNSNPGIVMLQEGNNYFDPTLVEGTIHPTGDSGILINNSNAKVSLAPVSSVLAVAGQDAIYFFNGTDSVVENAGVIAMQTGQAAKSAVEVAGSANNSTLMNTNTGKIFNNSDATQATIRVTPSTSGFVLDSAGLIQSNAQTYPAVSVSSQFNTIQNSGLIEQTVIDATAPALFVDPAIDPPSSGSIINTVTGVITLDGINAQAHAVEINFTGTSDTTIAKFSNAGLIQNLTTFNAGVGSAININHADGTSSGIIETFENSGRIYNQDPSAPTVLLSDTGPKVLVNGLVNSGDIVHGVIGKTAIDLSNVGSVVTLINSGNIVGEVNLAPPSPAFLADNEIFRMTAGSIAGTVTPDNIGGHVLNVSGGTITRIDGSAVTTANTYKVSGGHITDKLSLDNGAKVNLSGDAFIGHIVNADTNAVTLTVTGGDFDIFDGNTNATLNVDSTFKTDGLIVDVPTINIQNAGTVFTANNFITGVSSSTFDINAGTTFVMNSVVAAEPSKYAIINVFGNLLVNTPNAVFDFSTSESAFTDSIVYNYNLVRIGTEGILRILGNNDPSINTMNTLFENYDNGVFNVQIFGPQCSAIQHGKMIVNAFDTSSSIVLLNSKSYIQPQFTGFLPRGSTMDIITVHTGGNANGGIGGPVIQNDATLIPYPSAIVSFTPEVVVEGTGAGLPTGNPEFNSILRLTVNRNTYLSQSSTSVTPGVAQVLDAFADSGCPPTNDIYTLLSNLDQIPTQIGVEQAMESLVPSFNYGMIAAAHMGMDSVFEAVTDRVFELAWNGRHNQVRYPARNGGSLQQAMNSTAPQNIQLAMGGNYGDGDNGDNFGDGCSTFGAWIRPIGAYIDQGDRDGVAGYHAKGIGLAIGFDWGVNACSTYGVALSYTKANVDDKAWAPKDESVKSWQGTLYGFYDFCYGIFLDAMVAYAHNNYHTNRVIHAHDLLTAANASWNGNQWGLQADLGWSIPNCNNCYFFAPFARLKYINVGFDDYVEGGAGDLSLRVASQDASEFMGGIGFRAGTDFMSGGVEWVPELMAMIGYDFHNDGQNTVGAFGVGPSFNTVGIIPGKTIFDLGLAVNAVCGNTVVTAKYNLELRDSYVGNAGYLQYYVNWG